MERNAGKITILFLAVQAVLYVSFLAADLTGSSITLSVSLKFTVIILCFCYVLFYGNSSGKSILFCMKTALFFTLVSDLFILVLDEYYYGVLTFIFAQQLYGIRLSMEFYDIEKEQEQRLVRKGFLIRLAVQAALLVVICLILQAAGFVLDELLIAGIFYFISIMTNTLRAIRTAVIRKGSRELVLFAAGITLFLLCDINVGLFNMSSYLPLPGELYAAVYGLSSILMWAFYAPSQVLIALSTRDKD